MSDDRTLSAIDNPRLFRKPNPWLVGTRYHRLWQDGYDHALADAARDSRPVGELTEALIAWLDSPADDVISVERLLTAANQWRDSPAAVRPATEDVMRAIDRLSPAIGIAKLNDSVDVTVDLATAEAAITSLRAVSRG